jgi:O-methyltransferase
MKELIRVVAKKALAPWIYKFPPFGLQPERLATYLHGLLERKGLQGDVAEIGCNLGGTSVIAARMLKRVGWTGRYICYDTFGGFVPEQFDSDVNRGTDEQRRNMFAANSVSLVRKILNQHGVPEVELVAGDITRIDEAQLSKSYSVILLDIDLADPTYLALKRFWPRMVPGGAVYVDDCPEGYNWKARVGYEKFCTELGLQPHYEYGLGVLYK